MTQRAELIARRARRIARAVTAEARVWLGAAEEPRDDVDDEVDVASQDSFPASDPPAWVGLRVGPSDRAAPLAPARSAGRS